MEIEDRNKTEMFNPYERLVDIIVEGQVRRVPENNTILRCLQFLALEPVSEAELCWNGDCLNCKVSIAVNGVNSSAIACRQQVSEGMEITKLSDHLSEAVRDAFAADDGTNILEL